MQFAAMGALFCVSPTFSKFQFSTSRERQHSKRTGALPVSRWNVPLVLLL